MTSDDHRPRTAGVLGYPIGQSKSPRLFRHWFDVTGIEGTYSPYLVSAREFDRVVRALAAAGLRGVNCTLPHKRAALEIADQVSTTARAIGAANTLIFQPDGEIMAENTDGFGFIENLRHGAPDWNPASGPAVILGAGGAARAAAHALIAAGCPQVRLANRTRKTAEALAAHFVTGVTVVDWNDRADVLAEAALLVNSTSLGMRGEPPLEISLAAAAPGMLVTDMVYTPLETDLLAAAKAHGLPTVDGLGMLLHQARPGFRAWFGKDPAVTGALRLACLEGY